MTSRPISMRRRLAARCAVGLARLLARRPPARIRSVLLRLARRTRPASHTETEDALRAVLAVSLRCAGPEACLPRSLAVVLLCRMSGRAPTWCTGVRIRPPFGAHAWVEAEGRPVAESAGSGYFRPLIVVGPGGGDEPASWGAGPNASRPRLDPSE
ncbi:lasso peptide biosynthesis B2 protein [Nonomuraea sp. H19]|uniref:lasso peptide biosynthesis B2 protein n=1 Tax=Nonomuraea sp. H19 TaxID=3452206 RepID=UPI003F89C1DC